MPLVDELAYRLLPSVPPGNALTGAEWRTLAAAADVLVDCPGLGIPPEQIADNVERFLCRGRSKRAFRVRALLQVLEIATLPALGARFSRLPTEARRRLVTQRMVGGRGIWGLCAKVKLLVLAGAYGDERAFAYVGVLPVAQRPRYREAPVPLRRPAPPQLLAAG